MVNVNPLRQQLQTNKQTSINAQGRTLAKSSQNATATTATNIQTPLFGQQRSISQATPGTMMTNSGSAGTYYGSMYNNNNGIDYFSLLNTKYREKCINGQMAKQQKTQKNVDDTVTQIKSGLITQKKQLSDYTITPNYTTGEVSVTVNGQTITGKNVAEINVKLYELEQSQQQS